MKSIVFSLQKGGTGKTSISVTLAAQLATIGKTALLDLDPQGNATGWLTRRNLPGEIAQVLLQQAETADVIMNTDTPNLDLLPTAGLDGQLKMFAETAAAGKPNCIKHILKDLEGMGYEYAVIDLSPSFGALEKAALIAADEVVTPIMPDYFGVDGLNIFANNLKHLRADMDTERPQYKRIVIDAIDNRIALYKKNAADTVAAMKDFTVYEIPVDPIFRKAQTVGMTIQQLTGTKPETLAAVKALADDITKKA